MLALAALGDRFGRKFAIVIGVLLYSLPGGATPFAGSPDQLTLIRFVTGLGIGGVLPNVVAMVVETAPRRIRAGTVLFVLSGYAVGGILSGLLAASMIPIAGWTVVFVMPAVFGILLAIILYLFMPESLLFLALHDSAGPSAKSVGGRFRFGLLFTGALRVITPLLWIGYFAIAATFLTILSWQVFIFEKLGLSASIAAIGFSLTSLSAVVLQLLLSKILDRLGPGISGITAAISCAAMLGLARFQDAGVVGKLTLAMIAVGGASVTMHLYSTAAGLFYPTAVRSRGVGWTTGVGRMGAIIGPVTAGYFIARGFGMDVLLYLIAIPYGVVIPICVALNRIYGRENV
jgi:AAHS family 4-hydroxybenzoate transporter-like MFS transporter